MTSSSLPSSFSFSSLTLSPPESPSTSSSISVPASVSNSAKDLSSAAPPPLITPPPIPSVENKRTLCDITEDKDDKEASLTSESTLKEITEESSVLGQNKKARRQDNISKVNNNNPSRTLYFGGVTPDIRAHDLLNHLKGGAVEAVRFLTEKSCAFVDFTSEDGAMAVWRRLPHSKRILIRGVDVRVAWAKSSTMSESVSLAVKNGASRCIFIGNIPTEDTCFENSIKMAIERHAMIDSIRVVRERACAFVHVTNIADAMRLVSLLSAEDRWKGMRISFGRDRCAPLEPREEGQIMERPTTSPTSEHPIRTVYLGGVPTQTTAEDLCNVVRGGQLEKIRLTLDKKCAFVTFIEPEAAEAFYQFATTHGIILHGHRLKPGRGQPTVMPNAVLSALRQGATRNIYIGNLQSDILTDQDLHQAFSPFGSIEMVNFVKRPAGGMVAFVNFCNILDAVKAYEGIRKNPLFAHCKISYGKDRCSQPLRIGNQIPPNDINYLSPGVYGAYPMPMLFSPSPNTMTNMMMPAPSPNPTFSPPMQPVIYAPPQYAYYYPHHQFQ